jgi:hypothetical protein
MLISSKQKFVFIHIPKAGGTSITKALEPFAYGKWKDTVRRVKRRVNKKWLKVSSPPEHRSFPGNLEASELVNINRLFPGHIKASELVNIIGMEEFESFFSFAVVRNPWDREVSQYIYILRMSIHHQHDLVKSLGSFDAYIKWLCAQKITLQQEFICSEDGELLVDFVGKFERLEDDFKSICSRIGTSASLPRYNVSDRKPYRQYYSEETRDLVENAFSEDITYFEYEF